MHVTVTSALSLCDRRTQVTVVATNLA